MATKGKKKKKFMELSEKMFQVLISVILKPIYINIVILIAGKKYIFLYSIVDFVSYIKNILYNLKNIFFSFFMTKSF